MWHSIRLKIFFTLFYIFGQTNHIPSANFRTSKILLFASCIPIALYFVLLATATYSNTTQLYNFTTKLYTTNDVIFLGIFKTITLTPNWASLFANICDIHSSQNIFKRFAIVSRQIESIFAVKTGFRKFENQFLRRMICIILLDIIGVAKKLMIGHPIFKPVTELSMIALLFYRNFLIFHITLLIDLLRYFLCTINLRLSRINGDLNCHTQYDINYLINLVRQIKLLHFRIWLILIRINKRFGWVLVIFLLETFIYYSYVVYWLFLNTENEAKRKTFLFLRNYTHLFYYFL